MGRKLKVYQGLPELPGATKQEKLSALYNSWYGCTRCGLHLLREGKDIVFARGNPDADVMIVGEAPGEEEERTSVPFSGPSGRLLNGILASVTDRDDVRELGKWQASHRGRANDDSFNEQMMAVRDEEFFITNIVSCRPLENATPGKDSVLACRERLEQLVYTVDPVLVVAVGETAASALCGRPVKVTHECGRVYDARIRGKMVDVTYPVYVTLHPSYLLRVQDYNQEVGEYARNARAWMNAMRALDGYRERHRGTPVPTRGIK